MDKLIEIWARTKGFYIIVSLPSENQKATIIIGKNKLVNVNDNIIEDLGYGNFKTRREAIQKAKELYPNMKKISISESKFSFTPFLKDLYHVS